MTCRACFCFCCMHSCRACKAASNKGLPAHGMNHLMGDWIERRLVGSGRRACRSGFSRPGGREISKMRMMMMMMHTSQPCNECHGPGRAALTRPQPLMTNHSLGSAQPSRT